MTPEEKLSMARECAAFTCKRAGLSVMALELKSGTFADDSSHGLVLQSAILAIDRMQERVRAETGWQDISTSPKDETSIDVWVVDNGYPYRKTNTWWNPPDDDGANEGWWDMSADYGDGGLLKGTATHWMPIPMPPLAIRETPHAEG